jgi:hypothetical protein
VIRFRGNANRSGRCVTSIVLCAVVFSLASAQTSKRPRTKDQTVRTEQSDKSTDSAEWTILLADLLQETRRVDSNDDRAYLMAEVANGYWALDNKLSKDLFTEALDFALPLQPSKETRLDPVSEILALATRRDISFGKALAKRTYQYQENQTETKRRSWEVATGLLDSSPQTAIELAMAGAAGGPSMNGMWLLF